MLHFSFSYFILFCYIFRKLFKNHLGVVGLFVWAVRESYSLITSYQSPLKRQKVEARKKIFSFVGVGKSVKTIITSPSANECQNPIGIEDTVKEINDYIVQTITVPSDDGYRKAPVLISRLSRGGKTTVLRAACRELLKKFNCIMISFNGMAGYQEKTDEDKSSALFRLITNQIDPTFDPDAERITDWKALDEFIGDDPFVLLIDEINSLCRLIPTAVANVLKKYFINKQNRQLIMTSHIPIAIPADKSAESIVSTVSCVSEGIWSNSISGYIDRSVRIITMPESSDLQSHLTMDNKRNCNGITENMMAYFGYIPSLTFVCCTQSEEHPNIRFTSSMDGTSNDESEFNSLIEAIMTGIPSPSLQLYFRFSSITSSETLGIRMKWPISYVGCMMNRFNFPIAKKMFVCVNTLLHNCKTKGDGMAWEQSSRLAILLRLQLLAAGRKHFDFFNISNENYDLFGSHVDAVSLGVNVTTPEDAIKCILKYAQ